MLGILIRRVALAGLLLAGLGLGLHLFQPTRPGLPAGPFTPFAPPDPCAHPANEVVERLCGEIEIWRKLSADFDGHETGRRGPERQRAPGAMRESGP